MDTHVVNAILTGCRSKSSLIESVSCSSKIIPPELSQDSDSSSNINWMKEQRADPNLDSYYQIDRIWSVTEKKTTWERYS